jgi:hypothetical protein
VQLFSKWDQGMVVNPDNQIFYTTQWQQAFLKYVENKYCAKHRPLSVNKPERVVSNNPFPSATASGSGQSLLYSYDLSSDNDYLTPKIVADMTPRCSDRIARLLTATRLYLNSPQDSPQDWKQVNPNCNDYLSDPIGISSTYWLPHITDRWHQPEATYSKYTDLSNVAHDIFSIVPQVAKVEASILLQWDVIGWRESKSTGETLRDIVIVRGYV